MNVTETQSSGGKPLKSGSGPVISVDLKMESNLPATVQLISPTLFYGWERNDCRATLALPACSSAWSPWGRI
ncbi:hypothetical protein ANANG_G00055520 [Anguilla anguilla]|uniref:Uncharacterized protein n=1 Tax=Anguilla anguilla TaxID=7936 RepID=A0A9D3S1H0_ANGAN|nr:hypothetical protein ANANG_G00055520 [Anguilla anguilla]